MIYEIAEALSKRSETALKGGHAYDIILVNQRIFSAYRESHDE